MLTIICIFAIILLVTICFKVLPALIGISFTIFLTVLQVLGAILLLPLIGIMFFAIDFLFIWLIITIVKAIVK